MIVKQYKIKISPNKGHATCYLNEMIDGHCSSKRGVNDKH